MCVWDVLATSLQLKLDPNADTGKERGKKIQHLKLHNVRCNNIAKKLLYYIILYYLYYLYHIRVLMLILLLLNQHQNQLLGSYLIGADLLVSSVIMVRCKLEEKYKEKQLNFGMFYMG